MLHLLRLSLLLWIFSVYYQSIPGHSLQPTRLVLRPPGQEDRNNKIHLECCPLMGGPPFLPLHVQVVVEEYHKFDFIPRDATKPETLLKLLTLQQVPGELRCIRTPQANETTSYLTHKATDFTNNYQESNLHILSNNCWTFALRLWQHLAD